jgi:transcriptional regulator with XRE-family HTH domain
VAAIELGHRLRAAREARGLSYRDVRESTGLALSHLQRLERGLVDEPSPSVLRKLAGALGVPYIELMKAAGYL